MSYTYPGQVFDHRLNPLKGWPTQHALDAHGDLHADVNINSTGEPPQSGMVVHVSATLLSPTSVGAGATGGPNNLQFEMGANLNQMAIFLWPSKGDPDVTNYGVPSGVVPAGTSNNVADFYSAFPASTKARLSGLVATGGFELESTEFDTAQTYAPGQLLRAVTSNTNANAGKMTNQDASGGVGFATSAACTRYVDSAVGTVSRGKYTNPKRRSALAFWSCYLPGTR